MYQEYALNGAQSNRNRQQNVSYISFVSSFRQECEEDHGEKITSISYRDEGEESNTSMILNDAQALVILPWVTWKMKVFGHAWYDEK